MVDEDDVLQIAFLTEIGGSARNGLIKCKECGMKITQLTGLDVNEGRIEVRCTNKSCEQHNKPQFKDISRFIDDFLKRHTGMTKL